VWSVISSEATSQGCGFRDEGDGAEAIRSSVDATPGWRADGHRVASSCEGSSAEGSGKSCKFFSLQRGQAHSRDLCCSKS
jgi:hypothetical protein